MNIVKDIAWTMLGYNKTLCQKCGKVFWPKKGDDIRYCTNKCKQKDDLDTYMERPFGAYRRNRLIEKGKLVVYNQYERS